MFKIIYTFFVCAKLRQYTQYIALIRASIMHKNDGLIYVLVIMATDRGANVDLCFS